MVFPGEGAVGREGGVRAPEAVVLEPREGCMSIPCRVVCDGRRVEQLRPCAEGGVVGRMFGGYRNRGGSLVGRSVAVAEDFVVIIPSAVGAGRVASMVDVFVYGVSVMMMLHLKYNKKNHFLSIKKIIFFAICIQESPYAYTGVAIHRVFNKHIDC